MNEDLSPVGAATLDPIDGVLAVLDRGSATGTNKFSLLLALMELAPLAGPDRRIPLPQIAEKTLDIHWDQVAPFPEPGLGRELVLSQVASSNREATAVSEVLRLQQLLPSSYQAMSLQRVRHLLPDHEWQRSVRRVRSDLVRNPVRLLQRIDGASIPFLYCLDPDSDSLVLTPEAVRDLTRFGPVIKEIVQARFVRVVLQANPALKRTDLEQRLQSHLFESEREMPGASVRRDLARLQGGSCIYTGLPLRASSAHLDHVVPWARVRLSSLGNFVLTTPSVNSSKSDLLLGPEPLLKWTHHLHMARKDLEALAKAYDWPADVGGTLQVAQRLYRMLQPGVVLWSPGAVKPAAERDLQACLVVLGSVA